MPNVIFDVTSASSANDTSGSVDLIGNFVLSVADLATDPAAPFDGTVVFEQNINGNWIISETFTEGGIYPGFNPVLGTYRFRVTGVPTVATSTQFVVNGYDKVTGNFF